MILVRIKCLTFVKSILRFLDISWNGPSFQRCIYYGQIFPDTRNIEFNETLHDTFSIYFSINVCTDVGCIFFNRYRNDSIRAFLKPVNYQSSVLKIHFLIVGRIYMIFFAIYSTNSEFHFSFVEKLAHWYNPSYDYHSHLLLANLVCMQSLKN